MTSIVNEMSDGMVLDAMNQLKEMNDKREKELDKVKDELNEYKKEMITAYGVIRLIDMMYKDTDEQIPEIKDTLLLLDIKGNNFQITQALEKFYEKRSTRNVIFCSFNRKLKHRVEIFIITLLACLL